MRIKRTGMLCVVPYRNTTVREVPIANAGGRRCFMNPDVKVTVKVPLNKRLERAWLS